MDSDVEESQSKDFKNVLPEVSRKPKMKVKAAKVFKYLLNFLQMKPKKFEDKEKLCIPSTPQDSFAYENPQSYEFDRLQTPNSSCHKPDGILSMSWSYLVHDPFREVSNLEEEKDLENEMFYSDSYFEDDYCQDFREKDWTPFRTPAGDVQNLSCRNRLFEPERTPCGEYRRSVVTRGTPCRRQASLPNFLVDSPNVSVSLADATETDPFDSELVDVEDFMENHPPVGLNIAFDNLLEETNSERLLYSLNPVPFLSPEEMDDFENSNEQSLNETYTCKLGPPPSDCYVSETSSSDNTPQNSCIARDSIHKQVLAPSAESILDFDEMLVSEMHPGLERCTLDMLFPSSSCVKSLTRDQCYQESTSPRKGPSKQYGSVESGYSSCECSPSSGSSPETPSQADVYDIKSINPYILPSNVIEVSAPDIRNDLTDKMYLPDSIFQQLPHSGYSKAAHRWEAIQTAFQTSTSSPMQIINTPVFLNAALPTISPIKQNFETPKMRLAAVDPNGSLKRNRHQRRNESTTKVPNFQSKFESNIKTSMAVADSFCDDDQLVTAAAELIVNRIQFTKEMQPYIKMDELVIYLKSYYTREIAKLSHRSVKSISDYAKMTKEAKFTTERLTPASCYCDLLTAILTHRPRVATVCEEFIFENYDYFIRSRDFFEAAPEIILMLLCNNISTIFGSTGLPLRFGDSGLELNTFLDKYVEKHRKQNSPTFFRVKNILTCIRKKRTDLTQVDPLTQKIFSKVQPNREFGCRVSKNQAHIEDSHSRSVRSINSKTPNVQREPLQTLCKGTRMFRNKQVLYKTQGNIPETTQKLLDFVGGRKSQRSSHRSKMSLENIQNLPELSHRYSVNVGKYNLLANSALPSELGQTRSGNSVFAGKSSIYDSRKWTLGRPSVKYVTAV